MTRIAVLGLGLIGGSLLRRLTPEYDVVGYDPDPATCDLVRAAGLPLAATVDEASRASDIVVMAVPPEALSTVLAQLRLDDRALFTDVGSVKGPAYDAVRGAGLAGRFVGGHPMAGTQRSGFAAADRALFDGAAWVLCLEPDTDLRRWLRVAAVVTGIGCRVVPASAGEHDAAVAAVSHLPHLLAAALAVSGGAAGPLALTLAAGSFRDGTRVAGSEPALTEAMCTANRAELELVLHAARELLADPLDYGTLLRAGHAARGRWEGRGAARTGTLARGDGDLGAALLRLGRAGGWVDSVAVDHLATSVPIAAD